MLRRATGDGLRACFGSDVGLLPRRGRYVVLPKDFEKGYKSNVKKSNDEFEFYK